MPRIIPESIEHELYTYHHECEAKVAYYASDIINNTVRCINCKKEIKLKSSPVNHMMITTENGKPILRVDIGLVLTEETLSNPDDMLSACYSLKQHIETALAYSETLIKDLPKQYHQSWWKRKEDVK